MTTHFDVLVIGAGPGGYVAAIRSAQLGKRVAVIEERYWGGVCLNVGCIPSKALLRNAEIARLLGPDKAGYGIEGDAVLPYGPGHRRSRDVSDGIVKGVHYLMRKNAITEINGRATLTGPRSVDVPDADGDVRSYTCDALILATGAEPLLPPGIQTSRNVVTYEQQILDDELPDSILIGGAGAIGVEFSYILNSFGVDVTLVELADRLVPTEDREVSEELERQFTRMGISVLTSTKVNEVTDTGDGIRAVITTSGLDPRVIEADRMLAAFGFSPRLDGYGLEATGVEVSGRKAIAVDSLGRTNVDGVYAIGDVTGKMMLAHVAESMGVAAAETIAGLDVQGIDLEFVPRATYCQPQIASFGFTEEQAIALGHDVATASFPFSANGKARAMGTSAGFAKIVATADGSTILGAHLIGPDVTEQLPALTIARQHGLSSEDVANNVFAHPTLSEAVKEAMHGIAGQMINL